MKLRLYHHPDGARVAGALAHGQRAGEATG